MAARALALLLLAAALPGQRDLDLRITAPTADVELGKAFTLSVVRAWAPSVRPEPWNERSLQPLTVRLVASDRRIENGRTTQTRRYDAYAFTAGPLTVRVTSRAESATGGMLTRNAALQLEVHPTLPEKPGAAELPRDPFPAPTSWLPWLLALTVLLGASSLLLLHARRRGRAGPPRAPPDARALDGLAALEARPSRESAVAAADLVRDFIEARFGKRTHAMTTEQLAAEPPSTSDEQSRRLARFLTHLDAVKYAAHDASEEEWQLALRAARQFVRGEADA